MVARLPLRRLGALAAVACAGLLIADRPAQAQRVGVDVALVLAVDVSNSMDFEEQEIQRRGYSAAFRHPTVVNAIRSGPNGRIAVTYMEWAEQAQQSVPWMIISNAADAKAFADKLDAAPIFAARRTSISNALTTAAELFNHSGVAATRLVIDVSGDGANNSGPPVESVRDQVLAKDIVINGLPIIREGSSTSTWMDVPDLDRYYKDCVVGGPGSFSLPVRNLEELQRTIRAKMVSEIAGLVPPGQEEPLFKLAQQTRAPRANCLIGEQRRGGQWDFSPPPRITPFSPGN